MKRTEIRITGFGGQGVVMSGYIIGRACAVNSDLHATMIQSFGPEARGSACSATMVISDEEVLYPYIGRPDIFIVMSSEGYDKYRDELKEDGILIYERDLVHPDLKPGQPSYGVRSTRVAESFGLTLVQNIVMMGFFTAVSGVTSRDAMRQAVEDTVPGGTVELNLGAFDAGWNFYQKEYGEEAATRRETAKAAESTA